MTRYFLSSYDSTDFVSFSTIHEIDILRLYMRNRLSQMANPVGTHQEIVLMILDSLSSTVGGSEVTMPCDTRYLNDVKMYLKMLREGRLDVENGKIMYI